MARYLLSTESGWWSRRFRVLDEAGDEAYEIRSPYRLLIAFALAGLLLVAGPALGFASHGRVEVATWPFFLIPMIPLIAGSLWALLSRIRLRRADGTVPFRASRRLFARRWRLYRDDTRVGELIDLPTLVKPRRRVSLRDSPVIDIEGDPAHPILRFKRGDRAVASVWSDVPQPQAVHSCNAEILDSEDQELLLGCIAVLDQAHRKNQWRWLG